MTGAVASPSAERSYPHALRAFASRDFRLFWGAAIVSTSGSQMQLAAIGWVVAVLTHSAVKVGLVAFAGVIPLLVLGPVGGSLADRFPRRYVLLATQAAQMAQAVTLFAVWASGVRAFWLIFALAFLGGVTASLNAPVWHAFVPELVPRRDLPNAVMLNSTQFNISKALGPVAAGLLLVNAAGASLCFLLNAVSFAAVLVALLAMSSAPRVPVASPGGHSGYWRDFVAGISYVRREPGLRTAMAIVVAVGLVSQPMVPLMPVIALDRFHSDALGFGALAGALGLGAIVGAIALGRLDGRRLPSRLVALGFVVTAAAVVGVGTAPSLAFGMVAIAAAGAGSLVVIATTNSCIQWLSDDAMRGRVVAIWLVSYGMSYPIGVLVQGALADAVGVGAVLVADGILFAAYFGVLELRRRLRTLDADGVAARVDVAAVDLQEVQ